MILFVLACASEEPEEPAAQCGSGESITVQAPSEGESYEWTADQEMLDAGGTMADEGHDYVVVTCPPCGDAGDQTWTLNVTVKDEDGSEEWAYATVQQDCG